jgi:uncharacterized membrane protein SirB2
MNSLTLLNISLVFHLVGLVLIAGSTLMDLVTTSQFWKTYSVLARTGIALLVLSGISMMTIMHGAYGQQTWMRIKIGLVVLVILNVIIVVRRNKKDLEKTKSRTRLFHISQLILFLIIFTLSVFKFN